MDVVAEYMDGLGCWLLLLAVPFIAGFIVGALSAHYGWLGL